MTETEKLRAALTTLLDECRDWADALEGERPSLDEAIRQAEAALNA